MTLTTEREKERNPFLSAVILSVLESSVGHARSLEERRKNGQDSRFFPFNWIVARNDGTGNTLSSHVL